jgi:hypothetical protein
LKYTYVASWHCNTINYIRPTSTMIDEILVHISTPATRQNDHLYRSLADAYLDFEPHTSHGRESQPGVDGRHGSFNSQLGTNTTSKEVSQVHAAVDSSVLSTSKESYGSFPSYVSFEGQADNPRIISTQPVIASANGSSIPSSSRLARLDHIHMHWKEQATPKSSYIKVKESTTRSRLSPDDTDTDTAFIEDTQLGAQALQSQLQDSYSTTSEDTSEDETESDLLLHDVSTILDSQRSTVSRKPGVLAPTHSVPTAASGFINVAQEVLPPLEKPPASSSFIVEPSTKKRKTEDIGAKAFETHDFSKLPIDAFPPAPKTSTLRPGKLPSQITKYLSALKIQNPTRFKPSKQYATPKHDDRGYWSITCSTWSAKSQHEFWVSMCEHISSGRLGWGITLHRDAVSSSTLGQVRLYCWAEVAEHTWLLVWLCSKGEIVSSDSKWIDAAGNVVFEV